MLSVIVPIFNRPEYSQVCLESLYKTDSGCTIIPIVIDNGSRNKTRKMIDNWLNDYDQLTEEAKNYVHRPIVRRFEKNQGFAAAINEGIREVAVCLSQSDDPVTILHNDTIPFPGWAKEMKECLYGEDEEVIAIVPRTNYANENGICLEEVRKRFLEVKPNNKERVGKKDILSIVDELYPNGKDDFLINFWSEDEPRTSYLADISSFCIMIKRSVVNDNPTWDEDFFPRGYEDKFWFLPLERAGFVCTTCNRAYVHHFGNITSDGPGFCFHDVFVANRERFERKIRQLDKLDRLDRLEREKVN